MKNNAGFTLLELLVAIGLAALMLGMAVGFVGNTFSLRVKKETTHLMATIQFAYNEAAMTGSFYRIVFDLNEQQYWLESSEDSFLIEAVSADPKNKTSKSKEKKEEEDQPSSSFAEADTTMVKKVKLPESVRLRDVYVAHQDGLMTEGRTELYFFPTGMTQLALVHFSDEDQQRNFSIIVNPITGKCRVEPEYIELETILEKS